MIADTTSVLPRFTSTFTLGALDRLGARPIR